MPKPTEQDTDSGQGDLLRYKVISVQPNNNNIQNNDSNDTITFISKMATQVRVNNQSN